MPNLPASAKARPDTIQPLPNFKHPGTRVLQAFQDHITDQHRHLQSQNSFFVGDLDAICQSVSRWRQVLPDVRPYYGKRPRR